MDEVKLIVGTEPTIKLSYNAAQTKEEITGHIVPSYDAQTVYPPPDSVFSSVEVDPIPVPSGRLEINQNGSYNVQQTGFVDVDVPQGVFPSGTLDISENGTYDISTFENADVNVPQGVFPSGTLDISENGTYDISTFENADVNVPQGVFPSGTLDISENGTYDVTNVKSVNVDVDAHPDFGVTFGDWNAQGFPTSLTTYGYTSLPAWLFFEAGYNGYNRPILYGWIDKIYLNEGITTIDNESIFRMMEKVTELRMPSTLRTLGGPFIFFQTPLALLDLSLIDTVVTLTTSENMKLDAGCVIRVKAELLNQYKSANYWKDLPNEWEGV